MLRTPGTHNHFDAFVGSTGAVIAANNVVDDNIMCVRPAFRMNLSSSSDLWMSAGIVSSDGAVEEPNVTVTSVTLPAQESLILGGEITLVPKIEPSNAADKTVTWKSSVPDTVSVSPEGVVTGLKEGWADITVTTNDGGKTATCRVTVKTGDEIISYPRTANGVTTWDCIWFGNYWQEDTNGDGYCFDKDIVVSVLEEDVYGDLYDQYGNLYSDIPEGSYQADEKQPIKWRVLDIDEKGNALLLADKLIDKLPYDEYEDDGEGLAIWQASTIRSYLNSYDGSRNIHNRDFSGNENEGFLNKAFTQKERNSIIAETVKNQKNPNTGVDGGADTEDKIFLLSLDEAMNVRYGFIKNEFKEGYYCPGYTDPDATRVAKTTRYTDNKPVWKDPEGESTPEKISDWWLRSSYILDYGLAYVLEDGILNCGGNNRSDYGNVRPAFRMNLESTSDLWSYAGTVCSGEEEGTDDNVTGVKLPASASVKIGSTITLSPEIEPSSALDKTVTWNSSAPETASVSPEGVVTGLKEGYADITVTTNDGGKTATCRVTVSKDGKDPGPTDEEMEKDINVVKEDLKFTMLPGEVRRLPINQTGKYIEGACYTSSDTKLVTVKNGVVTAKNLKKGETEKKATVTVEYCGTKKAFDITVTTAVKGKVPENTAIQHGTKKYKITAPKTIKMNYGANKSVSIGIPAQLRGSEKPVITCNIVTAGVCEIGGKEQGVFNLSDTDVNLNTSGSKASVMIKPQNAGATYVIWSMKDENGTSQAVTKVMVKKPLDMVYVNQAGTGLDLAVGESKRLIVLNTMDNTDARNLSFSIKMKSGKGIFCSKTGFVTAASTEKAEAIVTVKSGKIKREITIRCPGRTENLFSLKQTSVTAKRPKSGAKAKSIAFKAAVPKKNPPEFTLSVVGKPQGITPDSDGKITVTDAASPGCYTVIATPKDKAFNSYSCELIVK